MWEANEEKQISKREDREKKVVDVYKAWVVAISDSGVWPCTLGVENGKEVKIWQPDLQESISQRAGHHAGQTRGDPAKGQTLYAKGKEVVAACVNAVLPVAKACLPNGKLPSGRQWKDDYDAVVAAEYTKAISASKN